MKTRGQAPKWGDPFNRVCSLGRSYIQPVKGGMPTVFSGTYFSGRARNVKENLREIVIEYRHASH